MELDRPLLDTPLWKIVLWAGLLGVLRLDKVGPQFQIRSLGTRPALQPQVGVPRS